MKHALLVLTVLATLSPAGATAQQRPRQAPPDVRATRRDTLEALLIRRFVDRAGVEMALDASQRQRLDGVLQATAERRRAVALRSGELQRRLNQAVRRPATPPGAFTQLLREQRALRREQQVIVDQEQDELGRFLTPRQQAHFLTLWVRLQQDARRVQALQPEDGGVR